MIATTLIAPLAQAAPTASGSYIVQVAKGANAAVETRAKGLGGTIGFRYNVVINGFSVKLPNAAVDALSRTPGVDAIEADGVVTVDGTTTQSGATWGISRIDQRALPVGTDYSYDFDGTGVYAFIIDTGIRSTHSEFGGRVDTAKGFTAITDGNGVEDCNGHGTHVAGTVGGSTYGVAKNVTLVPVRVLDCTGSGSTSGVIAGVEHVANWAKGNTSADAVANMSLGGGAYSLLDTAVNNAVAANVVMAVAAGNNNANACNYSPARASSAITVGATTISDARASYSNYGSCLDIFAPGSSITSSWFNSDSGTNTISGTSMATPHVAGAAALLRAAHADWTATTVIQALISNATPSVVTSAGTGSPNRLLYSLESGSTPPPTSTKTVPGQISVLNAATGSSKGTLFLTWKAPSDTGGGTISSYAVNVYAANGTLAASGSVALTSVTVSRLRSGAAYYFTVAAVNEVGKGPTSAKSNTATAR